MNLKIEWESWFIYGSFTDTALSLSVPLYIIKNNIL